MSQQTFVFSATTCRGYSAHCTACAGKMREFSPKNLMTLTKTADCVNLLPTADTVPGWKFESGYAGI